MRLSIGADLYWDGFLGGEHKPVAVEDADFSVLPLHSENFGLFGSVTAGVLKALPRWFEQRDTDGRIYCEASFSRGSGLGNRLFPWARCKVFSVLHGVPMLAPMWFTPRVGPLVRGGTSVRVYHRQILLTGLFRKTKDYVRGYRRLSVKCRSRRAPEPDDLSVCPVKPDDGCTLVSFSGARKHFLDLLRWRSEIRRALRAEAQPNWLSLAERFSAPVAINVRCGNDFRVAKTVSDFHEKGGIKTPVSWFVESLNAVREAAGWSVPAVVVSDGTQQQLGELLEMQGVRFARPGCAISDLLTLANARFLIGSGGSSFSAWGAFLSGAPTISHPGQSLEWFKVGQGDGQFVREFDPHLPMSMDLTGVIRRVFGIEAGRIGDTRRDGMMGVEPTP